MAKSSDVGGGAGWLPAIVSVYEAAKIVGVHPQTIRRWIAEGRLRSGRAINAGSSRVRIRVTDLLPVLGIKQAVTAEDLTTPMPSNSVQKPTKGVGINSPKSIASRKRRFRQDLLQVLLTRCPASPEHAVDMVSPRCLKKAWVMSCASHTFKAFRMLEAMGVLHVRTPVPEADNDSRTGRFVPGNIVAAGRRSAVKSVNPLVKALMQAVALMDKKEVQELLSDLR